MSNTQHDELSKEFTVQLASSYRIVSGEAKCLTEGTVEERYDTGVERLSEGTVDGAELREVDAADQDYQTDVIGMDRRWVDFKEYYLDVSVKKADQVRSAIQPNASFVSVQASAVNRMHDKVLIDSVAAVAYAGKTGTTQKNLVAGSTIAHGGTGFTIAKANDVIERMKTRGKVNDGDTIYCLWNARMEKVFKMTQEVASSLYNYDLVLAEGFVRRWGPIQFIRIEDFVKAGVAVTRMLPWTLDGVAGGTNLRKAIFYTKKTFTRWRPLTMGGVVNWDWQKRRWVISTDAYAGCARFEDDGAMVMECAETPDANGL